MDQGLVDEILNSLERIKGHAIHFMNDPPSRSWDGWRGRSDTCIKKTKQIYQQLKTAVQGLVKRTNANINQYKQLIQTYKKNIIILEKQINTLQKSHNSIQNMFNNKTKQKEDQRINKDKIMIKLNQQITLLKNVINQNQKNSIKARKKYEDLKLKNEKLEIQLKQMRSELKNAYNNNDKFTQPSIRPSTKDMPKSSSQRSMTSDIFNKSSSNKVFHYQKTVDCFSKIHKNNSIQLLNNNQTFRNSIDSKFLIVLLDTQKKFDKLNNQIFGFKVFFGDQIAIGFCNQRYLIDKKYSLESLKQLQKNEGYFINVKTKEDNPKSQMFVGFNYIGKKSQFRVTTSSKSGKKDYFKELNHNFFESDMRLCLFVKGKCQISLIKQ